MSWCLFSAAFVDSPAEEEGREVIKKAERKNGGQREAERTGTKLVKTL